MRRIPILFTSAMLMIAAVAQAQTTREVNYTARSIVHVNAKLRFTTMIILPETEEILDFVCGDKDFWVISGAHNLAYVKPAKTGASTNLNLVTASGNVYSFLLTEAAGDPDLKLYVTPDDTMKAAAGSPAKYYTAAQMNAAKLEADDARRDAAAAEAAAAKSIDERVNAFRSAYPTELQFPYTVKGNTKAFNVVAIFHDDKFTYIKANASELPSLYEIKDDAPNLVNFQVENGVYVVPKVLDSGYLTIGKQRLTFELAK